MITFGQFEITPLVVSTFRLDGGAMFGSVPKNLWSRLIAADEANCITLASRSLLVKFGNQTVLVDVGLGDFWSPREKEIFAVDNKVQLDQVKGLTAIVLTHLHFDHAGGISYQTSDGARELLFPHLPTFIQKAHLEYAQAPSLKDRASFRPEVITPLLKANLHFTEGSQEIFPDFWVHRSDGHTTALQWIEFRDGSRSAYFLSDIAPTRHHIPLPYHMGYDLCAKTLLREKEELLAKAAQENNLVLFQHDSTIFSGRVTRDQRGNFSVTT